MPGFHPWLGAKPPHPLKTNVLSSLATAITASLKVKSESEIEVRASKGSGGRWVESMETPLPHTPPTLIPHSPLSNNQLSSTNQLSLRGCQLWSIGEA